MKKIAVAGAVLAGLVAMAPVALANEDEPADCAAAVVALNEANAAHVAAVDADAKLADAEAADQRLTEAQTTRNGAQNAVAPIDTVKDAKDARTERQAVIDNPETTIEDRQAAQEAVKALNRYIRAEGDLADAEKDAKADTSKLRKKADETDADALKKALDEARKDFDRVCLDGDSDDPGPTTAPVPTTPATPAPVPPADVDVDVNVDGVAVPTGGVATGGGPA